MQSLELLLKANKNKEKTVKINVGMSNFFFKNLSKMAYLYCCLML